MGQDWFLQQHRFQEVIKTYFPEYDSFNFHAHLYIPARYHLHLPCSPSFTLKAGITETHLFDLLTVLTRTYVRFEMNCRLSQKGQKIFLDSPYQMMPFLQIVAFLKQSLGEKVDFLQSQKEIIDFQIILANGHDENIHKALFEIAQIYWKHAIKTPLPFSHVSLCYCSDIQEGFKELVRLPLKMIY